MSWTFKRVNLVEEFERILQSGDRELERLSEIVERLMRSGQHELILELVEGKILFPKVRAFFLDKLVERHRDLTRTMPRFPQ